MNLLDEMHQHVGSPERKEEPHRLIAPEGTGFPQMAPLHRFDRVVIAVNLEGKVDGIDKEADGAPHHVRNQQPFRLVLDVGFRVARDRLVEVARLEEEEAHEEERPSHHLLPPVITFMTAEGDGVETNHADDADATQKVECMVTFLHSSRLTDSQSSFP